MFKSMPQITYEETVEIEDDEPADTNSSSSSNATDKDADKDSTSSADAEEGDEAVIEAETTASAEPADSEGVCRCVALQTLFVPETYISLRA